jgi:predicted acetyltransferase
MTVSEDAIKLHERFQQINKDLQAITASANKASTAFKNMTNAANGQFTGATRDAKTYADSMDRAARSANAAAAASRSASSYMPAVLAVGYATGRSDDFMSNREGTGGESGFSGRIINGPSSAGSLGYTNNVLALPLLASGGGKGGGVGPVGVNGDYIPGGGGRGPSGRPGYTYDADFDRLPPPPGGGNGRNGAGSGSGGGKGSKFTHTDAMTNLAVGYFGFETLDKFVEQAAKYQTLTEKFNQFGMGDAALKEAEKFTEAQKTFGVSNNEMLADFIETQGVYRESGAHGLDEQLRAAKIISPMMAQLNVAMQGLDEKTQAASSAKKMDMLRFLETAGAAQSPARAKDLIEGSFKAIQASGGNIDFTQYRQFMAKAGTSAFGLTNLALFAEMEPIIGEMKGSSAGDAFMTAYNRAHGILQPTHQAAKEWLKLGLWNSKHVSFNSQGRVNIDGDPLADKKLFDQSQVEFYLKDVLPKYKELHYSEEDIRRSNAILFGRTGGKMYNLIDKQQAMIESGVEGYSGFRGLDDATKGIMGTYNGKGIDC